MHFRTSVGRRTILQNTVRVKASTERKIIRWLHIILSIHCRIYLRTGVDHPAGSDSREVCVISDGNSLRIVDVERVGHKANVHARIEDLNQAYLSMNREAR